MRTAAPSRAETPRHPAELKGSLGLALALVLAGYGLRVYRLDVPSLGYDESFNLFVASSSLAALPHLLASAEPYPPLHFVLLHGWVAAAGSTEFAARYWALLAGVALIPLVYQLARHLWGTPAGLLTAALATLSPAFLWYAQEIKMYPLLAALSALSLALWARLLLPRACAPAGGADNAYRAARASIRPRAVEWTGYVLATAAALYVHYTAVLIVATEVIITRLVMWRSCDPRRRLWLAAQAVIAGLFLPWVWVAQGLLGTYQSNAPASANPLPTLLATWQVFTVGYSDEIHHHLADQGWVLAAGLALLAWAVVCLLSRGAPRGTTGMAPVATLALLGLPLGLFLGLILWRPVFAARHATVIAIGYYLVIGCGLTRGLAGAGPARLGRGAGWPGGARGVSVQAVMSLVLLLGLIGLWATSVAGYFHDPAYTRTDNRAVAEYVRAHAGPTDVLVFDAPFFASAVLYYRPGDLAIAGLPAELPLDPDRTAARLEELVRQHPRVWLALWQDYAVDPDRFVERWLDRNAARQVDKQFASIRLVGYATDRQPRTGAAPSRLSGAVFGDRIRLNGYDLAVDPAGALDLALYWERVGPIGEPYTVFVHVVDQAGRRIGQWDQQPKGGRAPTHEWLPGEVILDTYRVAIEPGVAPAGVQVGLYLAATQARLPVTSGAPFGSTALTIEAPPAVPGSPPAATP